MSASVCLRILLDLSEEKLAKLDALGPVVAKVTSAFLETCWSWPDRYSLLTPFSFLLTEPGATEVNVERLTKLAFELQVKLFGDSHAGDVILLLLDGSELDTARFVQMDHASLKRAIQEPMGPTPFGGRLMKMSTAAGASQNMHWRKLELERPPEAPAPVSAVPIGEPATVFSGLYALEPRGFIGSLIASTPASAPAAYSLVDGADQLPGDNAEAFDMASIEAAARVLERGSIDGMLFLPVSFSSLMRRSKRELYAGAFKSLPPGFQAQLGAAIYDVPRSLVFNAVTQLNAALSPFFSHLDIQISDPAFEVDQIPSGVITSATFRLPEGDDRGRLAALRRLADRRDAFERRLIRTGVTQVRTRTELQACLRLRVDFLSGWGVCGPMSEPLARLAWDPLSLPLKRVA